jgi:hypothetical protein
MKNSSRQLKFSWIVCAGILLSGASINRAMAQASPSAPTASAPPSLEALSWLAGCWEGKVNQRDFREEWLPLRGDIMVGVSQTAVSGKTQDFEYLRLEPRGDGIYYVAMPSGKNEDAFRLSGMKLDGSDEIFTFESPRDEFPQRIIYRRGTEGWLYAHVEGKLNGAPKQVIYPMRRVDCRSGELILK